MADGTAPEVERLIAALTRMEPCRDSAAALARIEALERLRNATAAVIARESVAFAAQRASEQQGGGIPPARIGEGVVGELALARRQSPHAAGQHLGWAKVMLAELPETFCALAKGVTTERRAVLVARETAWLSAEHRAEVDRCIAPELATLGDRKTERRARALAVARDAEGRVRRLALAESQRRVALRPAPDMMTWFSALLPLKQGVAVLAALRRAADTAPGDGRSRGQVMADALVERVTGQETADAVPLTVNVTMPVGALLDAGRDRNAPGIVEEYGAVPADIARDLVRRAAGARTTGGAPVPMWIRRLFTAPDTGQLVTMESRSRFFTEA